LHITVSAPDSVWNILTAVGTIGAVAVALYVSVWRSYRLRPKLSLSFDPGPTSSDLVVLDTATAYTSTPEQAWVRLEVHAENGRDAAEDTEVMIVAAREIGPRHPVALAPGLQAIHTRSDSIPIPVEGQLLVWSNTGPPPSTRLNIPSGVHRHIDLLCVTRGDREIHNYPSLADGCVIQVYPTPSDGRHCIRASRFLLDLAITARNARARYYRAEVSFDGCWGDAREGIRDHLCVSLSTPSRGRELTPQQTDPTRAS
jgi:hypothetical protein